MIELSEIKITKSVSAIMKVGEELFWKHGVKRITVEEICEKASVSKMTFYRSFGNKYDLALHVFRVKMDDSILQYDEIMNCEISYPEKVERLMEFKRKEAKNVSVEFLQDVFSGDEEVLDIKKFIEEYSQQFLLKLRVDFQDAQKQGYIRPDLKIDLIIQMLNVLQHAIEDPALRNIYSSTEDLTMEILKLFFYGIMKENRD